MIIVIGVALIILLALIYGCMRISTHMSRLEEEEYKRKYK